MLVYAFAEGLLVQSTMQHTGLAFLHMELNVENPVFAGHIGIGDKAQYKKSVNFDLLNKLLGASASYALIVGVVVGIVGVFIATQTLRETRKAASATLVLTLRDTLDDDRRQWTYPNLVERPRRRFS